MIPYSNIYHRLFTAISGKWIEVNPEGGTSRSTLKFLKHHPKRVRLDKTMLIILQTYSCNSVDCTCYTDELQINIYKTSILRTGINNTTSILRTNLVVSEM